MHKAPRGMAPHNHPEPALAQEWLADLDDWLDVHGLKGYDPFDVKAHPLLRALQTRPRLRKLSTALTDYAPYAARRVLRILPAHNPKAYALVALGKLRLYELTREDHYAAGARACLRWLLENPARGYPGLCWGYPFDVHGSGVDTHAGTPVAVVSAIAGEAFAQAHRVLGEEGYLDAALHIGEFLLTLPRLEGEGHGLCFAYTPSDRRRIHNANLLVAEHLWRVAKLSGEEAWAEAAKPALAFTLAAQADNGSFPYGAWSQGEPYEPALMGIVDHYHTGFVLRSLYGIWQLSGDASLEEPLRRGWEFYRKNMFGPWGVPLNAHGRYPVDIHACAEGVLCPAVLAPWRRNALVVSRFTMRWTHYYLRRRSDGAPYYRQYPWFTSRLVATRWGVAWMYRALAEYLYQMISLSQD